MERPLLAPSGHSLVRRCYLWANLEEREARTARLSSKGILELADLGEAHRENGRLIPPPSAPQEVVGCDQPVQRLPSVAAMAWPAAASRSTEDGAEAWGAAGARDRPMAGSQDRRFPRAGMKNSFYIKGD
jgi:hypothetical protein